MFSLFALLRDDPLKPATPLTNGAIDETLKQFAPLSDDCLFSWLIVVNRDVDKPSVEGHPKQRIRLDSSPGYFGATV